MKKLLAKIRKLLRDRRTRQIITRFVSITAAIVVFVTTYALVLPAITMESEAYCGIPAHQHSDDCYELQLICEKPETEGHAHTDACYRVSQVLTCEREEHQHGSACYNEAGELVCGKEEHTHSVDDGCYEEERVLTCDIPESVGHVHTGDCYEKVLTCGKEVHTHSTECYVNPASGASSTSAEAAVEASDGGASTGAAAASTGVSSSASISVDDSDMEAAGTGSTEQSENTSTALTTVENATAGVTADGSYIPQLDPVDFTRMLNKNTGIYYHPVADGEIVEDSTQISFDGWTRVDKNTELGTADLLRVYLAYSIPAGSLNATNPVARYRLPANLHVSDAQVNAINTNINGIAGQYVNMDTLEILDVDKYYAYLGVEAVEGTRTPSDDPNEYLKDLERSGKDAAEYISALVRVENVYDEQTGDYLGQDMVFTWTPYSIEKNQHEYDATGQPTKAGTEIEGWLTLDFNLSQVDLVETAVDTFEREVETTVDAEVAVEEQTVDDHSDDDEENGENDSEEQSVDAHSVETRLVETVEHREQTADIMFVAEGRDENNNKIHEISTTLTVVEETVVDIHSVEDQEAVDDTTVDNQDSENAGEGATEEAVAATTEEAAVEDQEKSDQEKSDESNTGETADEANTADTADTSEQTNAESETEEQYSDGTLTAEGDGYRITLDYTTDAKIPNNAQLNVTEITEASDKEAYEACLEAARQSVSQNAADGGNQTVNKSATRFFDIEIVAEETATEVATAASDDPTVASEETVDDTVVEETVDNDSAEDAVTVDETAVENDAEVDGTNSADGEESATGEAGESNESTTGGFRKIEPAAPVSVRIELFDTASKTAASKTVDGVDSYTMDNEKSEWTENNSSDPTVLHFTEDGLETIESTMVDATTAETSASASTADTNKNGQTQERDGTQAIQFDASSFSIYGVVYTTITTTVLTASGETYEITVDYDENAQIPVNAELKVHEITAEEEEYGALYQEASQKATEDAASQGVSVPVVKSARLFDIEIHAEIEGEDTKIEPAAPVQVSIKLVSYDVEKEADVMSVIHFSDNGTVFMNLTEDKDEGLEDENTIKLSFEAESFSVYTVQTVTSLSNYLNNAKYAIVSQNGPNIGSANTDNAKSVSNYAMISSMNGNTLSGKGVYLNGTTVGGDVTEWGFESAGSNQYYIFTMDGTTKKYVRANGTNLEMTDDVNNAGKFSANAQSGRVRFSISVSNGYGGSTTYYITNSGNNPSKFELQQYLNDTSSYFMLCEVDPNYEELAAKKVSAEDWKAASGTEGRWDENDTIVIYRRILHTDGSEDLYVLATDGTLIPAYDGGDSIYYHCPTGKSVSWHVTVGDDGFYISDIGDNVYLAPSVTDEQWSSSTPEGLTMNGMGSSYGTAIEDWDQAKYAYAGLHADTTNKVITYGIGATSDTFLFAVSDTLISEGTLHTVDTVNSTDLGITMKVFNYGGSTYHYGYRNYAMQAVMGDAMTGDWDNRKSHVTKTVQPKLVNGYPVSLTEGYGSYEPLFTVGQEIEYTGGSTIIEGGDANNLFLQSYYDENGMFRYSSMENFAHYNSSGTNAGKFTVYRETGTPNTSPTQNDHYYFYHGHFMPYNNLDPNVSVSRIVDQYGKIDSKEQARAYENVYGLQEAPDYYVGLTLEADFVQPRGGKTKTGDPVVYRFTGDDDLLVFIDDILVLDVGGIHEPLTGSINFETGVVTQPNFYDEGEGWEHHTTTIYQIFKEAKDAGYISDAEWAKLKWKNVDGKGDPETFADFTTHSFNMFYMERGAGASNLDLAFNLQIVKTNEFIVQKEIPEKVDPRFENHRFKFRATFMDGNVEKPLYKGATTSEDVEVCSKVVYKDKKDSAGKPIEVEVDNQGYFYLMAGETVVFTMADKSIEYNVKEVDIDTYDLEEVTIEGGGTTQHVEINDQQATIENNMAAAGVSEVQDQSIVLYTNYPKTQDLLITKHITKDSAPAEADENPVFEFRVYLETTEKDAQGNLQHRLVPYSYGPYYLVKDVEVGGVTETHYFTLDGPNNTPKDHLTEKIICSKTGRSGSINSIPPEYTIVIPDLAIGTNFYLEERRDNIPVGYHFVEEVLKDGTYDESTLIANGASSDVINRVIARDENDKQEFDPSTVGQIKDGVDAESHVYNRKPIVDLTVEKKWVINGQEPATWPEDMTVEYSVVRQMVLPVGGTEHIIAEEIVTKPAGITGVLDAVTQTEVYSDLRTSGMFTVPANVADQSDITKAAIASGIIEAGKSYRVAYVYKAVETAAKHKGVSLNIEGVEAIAVKTADAVEPQEATATTPAVEGRNQKDKATLENRLISVTATKQWEGNPYADSVEMKLYRTIRMSQLMINVSLTDEESKAESITAHINGEDVVLTKGDGNVYTGSISVPYGKSYPITFTGTAAQGYIVSVEGSTVDVASTQQTADFTGEVTAKTTDVTITVEMTNPDNAPASITAHVGNYADVTLRRGSGDTYTGSTTIRQGTGETQITFDAETDAYHTVTITPGTIQNGYQDSLDFSTIGTVVTKTGDVTFSVTLDDADGKATGVSIRVNGASYNLTKGANNVWTTSQPVTLPLKEDPYPVQVSVTADSGYTVSVENDGAGEVTVQNDTALWSTTGTVTKTPTRTITWVIAGARPNWAWLCYTDWSHYDPQPTITTTGNGKVYVAKDLPADTAFLIQQGDLSFNSITNRTDYSSYNIRDGGGNQTLLDIPAGTEDVTIILKVGGVNNVVLLPYTVIGSMGRTGTIKYVNYTGNAPIQDGNQEWNTYFNPAASLADSVDLNSSGVLCFTNLNNPTTGYYMIHKNGYSAAVSGTGVVTSNDFIYVPVNCTNLTFGSATPVSPQSVSNVQQNTLVANASSTRLRKANTLNSAPMRSTPVNQTIELTRPEAPTATITGNEGYPTFTSSNLVATQNVTAPSWTYTWDYLPEKDADGNTYDYYVVETIPNGTESVTYARQVNANGSTVVTIENKPLVADTARFTVTKVVQGDGLSTERSFTIRLQRTKDGMTKWLKYEGVNQCTWLDSSSGATTWTFKDGDSITFTGLETGYTYTVVEDTGTGMIEIENYNYDTSQSTTTASANVTSTQEYTGTITNKYTPVTVNIDIEKVDETNTSKKLGGATFRLTKVQSLTTENLETILPYDQTGATSDAEATKGQLQFTGLTVGYYYLKEVAPPDGYVSTTDGWHFQVTKDGIVSGVGDFDANGKFRYKNANGIMVTNEPGAALPNTGGPGTRFIYLIGALLTLAAALLLLHRRKQFRT